MATTPRKPLRRPGRPSKAEKLAELGIDPGSIDPKRILASIAADVGAAPTARVSAARALLPSKGKVRRRSKKAVAAARAAKAGGGQWGADLTWPDGRRQ